MFKLTCTIGSKTWSKTFASFKEAATAAKAAAIARHVSISLKRV